MPTHDHPATQALRAAEQPIELCEGDDCEASASLVSTNGARLCEACAAETDEKFWAKCDHCGDDCEASFEEMDCGLAYCDEACANKAENEEIDMQYEARHR